MRHLFVENWLLDLKAFVTHEQFCPELAAVSFVFWPALPRRDGGRGATWTEGGLATRDYVRTELFLKRNRALALQINECENSTDENHDQLKTVGADGN